MDLSLSGLASNFDWKTLVSQLGDAERAPQLRLRSEQNTLNQRNNAYSSIKTQLLVLKSRVDALKDPDLYGTRSSSVTDSTIASVSASTDTPLGSIDLTITQLATSSKHVGAIDAGRAISSTNDVSGVIISGAGFSTPVSAGTFTVNGHQVTIESSDTLQAVFDQISAQTNGEVTASYDSQTDRITLSGNGPIVLGSANDTSNFLQVSRLTNNGTGTITSAGNLGGVRRSVTLGSSNLGVDVSDGGAGAGEFKINGVSINYDTSKDSVNSILDRINSSAAGVNASYDATNDRFVLTNQLTGDVGVALEDVTGNFLAATGLVSGTLTRGQNLVYSIDGGPNLTSQSNTITESSSGIAGLSISVAKAGSTKVSVETDTAKVRSALEDFLTEFNKVQSMIDSQTEITTSSSNKVSAGLLSSESDVSKIATTLRSYAYSPTSALSTALKSLDDIGIKSNGNDNSLKIDDSDKLDAALNDQLGAIKNLFSDETNGLAAKLSTFLDQTVGEEGTLVQRQDRLTKEAADIDVQIADLEKLVQANQERLTASFLAMEQASARNNQQLQFLQQRFGGSSGSN